MSVILVYLTQYSVKINLPTLTTYKNILEILTYMLRGTGKINPVLPMLSSQFI